LIYIQKRRRLVFDLMWDTVVNFLRTDIGIVKYFLWTIVLLFILLVASVIFNYRNKSYRKQLFIQVILYLIEITVAVGILSYLLTSIEQKSFSISEWKYGKNYFKVIERLIFSLSLYQGILYLLLKLKNSADQDSFTALKYHIDELILFFEAGINPPQDMLKELNDRVTIKNGMYNNISREKGIAIIENIEQFFEGKISREELMLMLRRYSRYFENQINVTNFTWMNSILLRLLK
jgi:hypothetical protein